MSERRDVTILREAMRPAFITCVSDGQAARYEVVAKFRTLEEAQRAHTALLKYMMSPPPSQHRG
jgi:hypothetical protein